MEQTPISEERQRLRFEGLTHDPRTDGRCMISVSLEWCGRMHTGTAEGIETLQGRIRTSSIATLSAVMEATSKRMHLELLGVKAVRAFDGWVVITSLQAEASGKSYRLLGSASCEADDGLLRTAVLSVLDASNRVLERYVRS